MKNEQTTGTILTNLSRKINEKIYFDDTVMIAPDGRIALLMGEPTFYLYFGVARPLLIRKKELINHKKTQQKIANYLHEKSTQYQKIAETITERYLFIKKNIAEYDDIKNLNTAAENLLFYVCGYEEEKQNVDLTKLAKIILNSNNIEGGMAVFKNKLILEMTHLFQQQFTINSNNIATLIDKGKSLVANKQVSKTLKDAVTTQFQQLASHAATKEVLNFALSQQNLIFLFPSEEKDFDKMIRLAVSNSKQGTGIGMKGAADAAMDVIYVPFQRKLDGSHEDLYPMPTIYGGHFTETDVIALCYRKSYNGCSFTAILSEEVTDYVTKKILLWREDNSIAIFAEALNRLHLKIKRLLPKLHELENLAQQIIDNKHDESSQWQLYQEKITAIEKKITPTERFLVKKADGKYQLGEKYLQDSDYSGKNISFIIAAYKPADENIFYEPVVILKAPPVTKGEPMQQAYVLKECVHNLLQIIDESESMYQANEYITELIGKLPTIYLKFPGLAELLLHDITNEYKQCLTFIKAINEDKDSSAIFTCFGEYCDVKAKVIDQETQTIMGSFSINHLAKRQTFTTTALTGIKFGYKIAKNFINNYIFSFSNVSNRNNIQTTILSPQQNTSSIIQQGNWTDTFTHVMKKLFSVPSQTLVEHIETMNNNFGRTKSPKEILADSVNQSLTSHQIILGCYLTTVLIKKYFPLTLPWNHEHPLTFNELKILLECQKLLHHYYLNFSQQQTNAVAKEKLTMDTFKQVQYLLQKTSKKVQQTLYQGKISNSKWSLIMNNINKIKYKMRYIAELNRQVKIYRSKLMRDLKNASHVGKKIGIRVTHNVIDNQLTYQSFELDNLNEIDYINFIANITKDNAVIEKNVSYIHSFWQQPGQWPASQETANCQPIANNTNDNDFYLLKK